MHYVINACISLTTVKCAAEVLYSASVGHEVFELEVFSHSTWGSATVSLLSITHFLLVCQAYSRHTDRKVMLHIGNLRHVYFSVHNLFPILMITCTLIAVIIVNCTTRAF